MWRDTCWCRPRPEWRSRSWSRRAVEGQPAWPAKGSAMGQGLEPEQIARRLPIDFPDAKTMRISHEAISQTLFVQGQGAQRRETKNARASCRARECQYV